MRKSSSLDLDEDSTIISLLTTRASSRETSAGNNFAVLKILLGCAVFLVGYVLLRHGT